MVYGFCIMNKCNITQNRVAKDVGGYLVGDITSDSYITCVNVVENNQSSGNFNIHTTRYDYSSIFKVTSCNYLRNKSPNEGYLITSYSNVFMNYCCIRQNEIKYIFKASPTITFENSTTDSMNSTFTPPTFKNTDIPFEISCPLLNSIPTKFKFKINQKENDEENNNFIKIYFKIILKLKYLISLPSSIL
ncbi:hypothetical protein TVAG_223740 [Trichomonas vaginalis G3]|uniref:Right handed beta helix domain-containing protein n=1 Tax=Trichomonas vaginalis (strain ATCC PRA-98 / G3) TaxID=412133 RepID=A2EJ79_TRIV3|nr:hypothetical protein TVAGG3_0199260 [Trichomonas vaginalis G3]EAY07311.1 hypothetical protein TVAG_223740 [Trichomonas vaginalis G3]KAI5550488.1 hypothetical protein TVAGG3_0199260 [Trichomonas vaginalis G3]|eukprot:XP_001319534.1 hypothetical protein [Trichomonas vaginalis G3]